MADDHDRILTQLLERCRRDHHAWINGDGKPYALPPGGSLFGGTGGNVPGGPVIAERQVEFAKQWTSGTGTVELVDGGIEGDLAWVAVIERANVVFAGGTEPRRWDLRVTEIFHREDDGDWHRVHRHADPLVDRHDFPTLFGLLPDH